MSKHIGEAHWKACTKKLKLELDDKALLKALAAFDKTDATRPELRSQALDDVLSEARKQTVALAKEKKELGDKLFAEVKGKLQELMEGTEKLLKETRAALEAAKEEDDEADSPVLLTSKMLPLIRELRKGEITMHALIGTAGKETAVLIRRRPIAPSMRKLIGEALDARGAIKYIPADCVFENKALTFIVKTQAAGLAKRLKAALLAQTELRLKVRVRGEDPGDVDEDGDDDGEEASAAEGQQAAKVQAPPAGEQTGEPPAFTQMHKSVSAKLQAALQTSHPELAKLKALSGYVSEKVGARDYVAATKALELLDKMLGTAAAARGPEAGDAGTAFKARLTALIPRLRQAQSDGSPGAQEAHLKAHEAGVFAGKRDFAQASGLLDQIELLLKNDAATALLALQWKERLDALGPRYTLVLQTQAANASSLRAILAYAQGAAEKREYAVALKALLRLDKELDAAQHLGKETDPIPEGIVKQTVERLEQASGRWRDVHFQSIEGLSALTRTLRADDDPELHMIADRVEVLTSTIPGEIEGALKTLSASMRSRDASAIADAARHLEADLDKCEAYLKDNLSYIEMCEEHPFDGIPVVIQKPLRETLASIRSSLAAI